MNQHPKYPSKKRITEKRNPKQKSKNAELKRILLSQGSVGNKYHEFLKDTGRKYIDKFDPYFSRENYGKTWFFNEQCIPELILKD